jgi:putative transposase
MAWNRKHQLNGHVWGERFFSRIIAGIVDFLRVFIYIDDNPVHAQLTDHPWGWEFGGLWHHQRRRKDISEQPGQLILHFFPEHGASR